MRIAYNARVNKASKDKPAPRNIAVNRRARHDYFVEANYEAGLSLQGWEVKSLRDGRAQIAEAYVVIRGNEAWLLGAHITPLISASTHVQPDPTRTRKLLLHRHELNKLIGATERQGYTLVPLSLYWHKGRAKLDIGLAKGKKKQDKRASIKEREWHRQKERLLKH
jgi:SsrA-binding protein